MDLLTPQSGPAYPIVPTDMRAEDQDYIHTNLKVHQAQEVQATNIPSLESRLGGSI